MMKQEQAINPDKTLRVWWTQPKTPGDGHTQITAAKFVLRAMIEAHPDPARVASSIRSMLNQLQTQSVSTDSGVLFDRIRQAVTPYLCDLDAATERETAK